MTTQTRHRPRIDSLTSGDVVLLDFNGKYEEHAIFVSMENRGKPDRSAKFVQASGGRVLEWEAYRYNGMWAYGSSAERLSVVEAI